MDQAHVRPLQANLHPLEAAPTAVLLAEVQAGRPQGEVRVVGMEHIEVNATSEEKKVGQTHTEVGESIRKVGPYGGSRRRIQAKILEALADNDKNFYDLCVILPYPKIRIAQILAHMMRHGRIILVREGRMILYHSVNSRLYEFILEHEL